MNIQTNDSDRDNKMRKNSETIDSATFGKANSAKFDSSRVIKDTQIIRLQNISTSTINIARGESEHEIITVENKSRCESISSAGLKKIDMEKDISKNQNKQAQSIEIEGNNNLDNVSSTITDKLNSAKINRSSVARDIQIMNNQVIRHQSISSSGLTRMNCENNILKSQTNEEAKINARSETNIKLPKFLSNDSNKLNYVGDHQTSSKIFQPEKEENRSELIDANSNKEIIKKETRSNSVRSTSSSAKIVNNEQNKNSKSNSIRIDSRAHSTLKNDEKSTILNQIFRKNSRRGSVSSGTKEAKTSDQKKSKFNYSICTS
jgi:hypothetical protein